MTVLRVDRLVVDVRALVDGRQEAVAPQLRADDRLAGAEHDEAGQVLVLGAQAVGQPRAQARPDRLHVAGVHQQQGALVGGAVGVHRADDAEVVDARWPTSGNSSLTSMPLWPCLRNLNGDASACAVARRPAVGRVLAVAACRGPAWGRRCRRATARRS